jgi:hypothetical protein
MGCSVTARGKKTWTEIIQDSYGSTNDEINRLNPRKPSPFWLSVVRALKENWNFFKSVLGDGKSFKFWLENWGHGGTLKDRFPLAYAAAANKNAVVADYWDVDSEQWLLNIGGRNNHETRTRVENERLMQELAAFKPMPHEYDTYKWEGNFSTAAAYDKLIMSSRMAEDEEMGKKLWKLKIPLKLQIFLWLCRRDGLITGDLRHRRMGTPTQFCYLCGLHNDSTDHIFSSCAITDYVWRRVCNESLPTWGNLWSCLVDGNKPYIHMVAVLWAVWRARSECVF